MTEPQERKPHPQAGPILRSLREERGLSQEELAEAVKCEVKAVRRWEQGKGIPQPENRRNLAKALNISVKALVILIQTGVLEGRDITSLFAQTNHREWVSKNDDTNVPNTLDSIFWYQAPLPDPQEFYGRARERETLRRNIRKGISTSIIGQRRIGKTWLMSYIQKEHPTAVGPQFCAGFLDATQPSCITQAGFINTALEVLDAPKWEYSQPPASMYPNIGLLALEKCVRKMRADNATPVLYIDEFEGFCKHSQEFPADFFTQLRSVAQQGLVLVTASKERLIDMVRKSNQTSPFFNIFEELRLRAFSSEEAREFLKAKSVQASFSDQEQDHLLQVAQDDEGRWPPARLQWAGQRLLLDKYGSDGDYRPSASTYWQEFRKRLEDAYRATGA